MKYLNGGGIMLPYSNPKSDPELSKKIFTHYLNNFNKVNIISFGRYGIVLLCSLPENIDTNDENNFYKKMVPNENYGKIVKSLLIKIQFVNISGTTFLNINKINVKLGDYEFTCVREKEIQNEVNIQTDIFFKTLNYMQPLCPSIVYADILKDYPEKINILNLLRFADNLPFPVENNIIFNNDIGLIAMEMIYDSIPLFNYIEERKEIIEKTKKYIRDKNIQNQNIDEINEEEEKKLSDAMKNINLNINKLEHAKNISRYALLKLALDTGYNHNDFHPGNILIQKDDSYFKDSNMSPILIDFGRTTKLDLDILNSIKQKVKQQDYTGALSELCKPYNSKLVHTRPEFHSYYNWVCGDYEGLLDSGKLSYTVDINIDELFKNRELAIDEVVKKMKELHDTEPEKYPLLPLSNNIKNKLYNGMIGGKRKQNYRQNRKQKTKKNKAHRKTNKRNKRSKTNRKYI
jgi:hypothetical protein